MKATAIEILSLNDRELVELSKKNILSLSLLEMFKNIFVILKGIQQM